jgi:hypothetical protein
VTPREVRDALEEKYGMENTLLDLQMLRLRYLILRTVAMLRSWDGL